jgi:hypothetical protein
MSLKQRFQRNGADQPEAIGSGDRFRAQGTQQSPGKRRGAASPGGRKKESRASATPIADREPRATANRSVSRAGEVGTSAVNPAGGKDPDRMPRLRSARQRGNPRADRSVRSYRGRDPQV